MKHVQIVRPISQKLEELLDFQLGEFVKMSYENLSIIAIYAMFPPPRSKYSLDFLIN